MKMIEKEVGGVVAAHAPTASARMVRAATAHRGFAARLGAGFTNGHRFTHDIPPDLGDGGRD
jgi:hypothetical protein